MKKDIKFVITVLLISLFLFALGMFITNNASFTSEGSTVVKIVPAICACLCLIAAFIGIFYSIIAIIAIICIEYHNKKVDKYYCKLRQEIKNELPKETEFSVSIANQNNEDLKKLLFDNLKCTASFDGSTIHIKFSLPKEVSLETDNVLWFYDNFKY